MNGGLEALTNLFSSGTASAGESALAPGAGVTSFLGGGPDKLAFTKPGGIEGLNTYENLAEQFMGSNPAIPGISEMGGYQGGMGSMMAGNQDYLKEIMGGGAPGGLSMRGGMGGQQPVAGGQPQMMAGAPQMPAMLPGPAPPSGTPPRPNMQATAMPGLAQIKALMAQNMLKRRMGIQ